MPITLSLKLTDNCNLSCAYCYERNNKLVNFLSLNSLEKLFIKLSNTIINSIQFVWHGGEPLIAGLEYFIKLLDIQKRYLDNINISNCIQTNGILLNQETIDFFRHENVGIGLSFDGPKEYHNFQRVSKDYNDTYRILMNRIDLLKSNGIPISISSVITNIGVLHAREYWDFFSSIGVDYIDFLPCQFYNSNFASKKMSVNGMDYALFLIEIFDCWMASDKYDIRIKYLENIILQMISETGSNMCQFTGRCSDFYTIDAQGNLYACDCFLEDKKFFYGKIHEINLDWMDSKEIITTPKQHINSLYKLCKKCEWTLICNGGCPYQHYLSDIIQVPVFNCESKKILFSHIYEKIKMHC